MDGTLLQTLVVAAIVGVAALSLGRRWVAVAASFRPKKKDAAGGCAGGCGCSSSGH